MSCVLFGDLFLADVCAYREAKMAGSGIEPTFPLWGRRAPLEVVVGEVVEREGFVFADVMPASDASVTVPERVFCRSLDDC